MAAICWRALVSRVTSPVRPRSSTLVAIASLIVELVHMTCSGVPVRHTAPVCRSRTTRPRYPGLVLTRLAASSKRRCWSQPHGPQSVPAAGVPDGAAPPGVAEPVGWPGAEPFAAGDPPVALAHLGDVPSV